MYRVGQGHEHLGPGTSLVQFINWTPQDEAEMRGFAGLFPEFAGGCSAMNASCREKGIGCIGCGGKCKSGCGLGLFDSGGDFTQWGAGEWALIALGGYVLISIISDIGKGGRRVAESAGRFSPNKKTRRRAVIRARKKAKLQKEMSLL